MKISNEENWKRANIYTISEQIFWRRLIGHVLRKEPNKHHKTTLTWAPEGTSSRGRPKETWWRTAEKERIALSFGSWHEATVGTRDLVTWWSSVWPYTHLGSWSNHIIVCMYFSSIAKRLLKLSTVFKFPLHRPCNSVNGTLGRSANCILSLDRGFRYFKTLVWVLGKET